MISLIKRKINLIIIKQINSLVILIRNKINLALNYKNNKFHGLKKSHLIILRFKFSKIRMII
jgi:hypothetical protein